MRVSVAERLEPQLQLARRQNHKYREQLKILARQNRSMMLVMSRVKAQQILAAEAEGGADAVADLETSAEEQRRRRDLARELAAGSMRPEQAELIKIYSSGVEHRVATSLPNSRSAAFEASGPFAALKGPAHRRAPTMPPRRGDGRGSKGSLHAAGDGSGGGGGAGAGKQGAPSASAGGPSSPTTAVLLPPGPAMAAIAAASSPPPSCAAPVAADAVAASLVSPAGSGPAAALALAESERARAALQVLVQGLEAELLIMRGQLDAAQQQAQTQAVQAQQQAAAQAEQLAAAQSEAQEQARNVTRLAEQLQAATAQTQLAEAQKQVAAQAAQAAALVRESSASSLLRASSPSPALDDVMAVRTGIGLSSPHAAPPKAAPVIAAGAPVSAAEEGAAQELAAEMMDARIATLQSESEARVARVEAAAKAEAEGLQAQVEALTAKCVDEGMARRALEVQAETQASQLGEATAKAKAQAELAADLRAQVDAMTNKCVELEMRIRSPGPSP